MWKKWVCALLVLVMLCSVGSCAMAVQYDEVIRKTFYKTSDNVYLWNAPYRSDDDEFVFDMGCNMDSGWKTMTCETWTMISKLKSSNKKVVKVKKLSDGGFQLWINKTGTAKITYVINGHNRLEIMEVLKYGNPCKSIKIGKTDFAGEFNNKPILSLRRDKLSGKITVKAAKGWKLMDIRQGGAKHLKNNQKVNLKLDGSRELTVVFQKIGKKYGCSVQIVIY